MAKFFIGVFVVLMSAQIYGACINESKNFEECLKCCGYTAQAKQALNENVMFASDVSAGCIDAAKSTKKQVAAFSSLYEKYKIDSSTFHFLCNDKTFLNEKILPRENYETCVNICHKRTGGKR